jgi:xylose isomerase
MAGRFRFSFGPWNIHEGADPFGPPVRESIPFIKKLAMYKDLGFDAVQFHDDDVVADLPNMKTEQIISEARQVKKLLDDHGLIPEFVAPRLWEHDFTIDGAYTANDPKCRQYAIERSLQSIDIANALGTKLIVLWLAREGTYIREAKDSKKATEYLVDALNKMLEYDPDIKIAIEPKPNEPVDYAFISTTGHALALAHLTGDPKRIGVVMESAHAVLAGLEPADEMGFAMAFDKLWTVHLNDQNGLKFDQDKTFGSVNLRRAFNQVRILDKYDYGQDGAIVGLDVKAMRTQKMPAVKHLRNSREIFLQLLQISRSLDDQKIAQMIGNRDYEELDLYIMQHLLAKGK